MRNANPPGSDSRAEIERTGFLRAHGLNERIKMGP